MFVEIQRFVKQKLFGVKVSNIWAVMVFIQNLISFSVSVMWILPFLNKSCGNTEVCVKEKFQIWIGFKICGFDNVPNFVLSHLAFLTVTYQARSKENFWVP